LKPANVQDRFILGFEHWSRDQMSRHVAAEIPFRLNKLSPHSPGKLLDSEKVKGKWN
jgi:hypothetical protein